MSYLGGAGGGGGGGPTIGLPVIGGNPNDVLFVDPSGDLGQNDAFQYIDNLSKSFTVGFSDGSQGLLISPTNHNGTYALGDLNQIYNSTYFNIADGSFQTQSFGLQGIASDIPANTTFSGAISPGDPGFFGSGLNDMQWNGYWNDSTVLPVTLTVNIDSINNATIVYSTLVGVFTVTELITGGTSGATATITLDDGAANMTVTNVVGVFMPSETITGGTSGATASLDSISDLYDTFEWSDTNGNNAQLVPIDGTNTLIENNINVIFGSLTGHVIADAWVWGLTITKGGQQLEFNSQTDSGPVWAIGDIDGFIKGQVFGLTSASGDANNWTFGVGDNRGTFLKINPVDAPSAGNFALGDIDKTNNGTFFDINDARPSMRMVSLGLFPLLSAEWADMRIGIGDIDARVNGTVFLVDDSAEAMGAQLGGISSGLLIDFRNAVYDLGDFGNLGNSTYIGVQDNLQLITFNGNYSFPFADGTLGQTLVTDGAGMLSFATVETAQAEVPTGAVDGLNVIFTLSFAPTEPLNCIVLLDGITQYNTIDYTVSGTTITFTGAPVTGTSIFAYYRS